MSDQSALSIERTHLAGAVDETLGGPARLKCDDGGNLRVLLMVYDTDLLEPVKLPLSAFDALDLSTLESIQAETYWKDQRFDYTSGDLDYKGVNITHDAAEGATTWNIWKYTWAAGLCTRIEGPLTGSWTGRAALAWA